MSNEGAGATRAGEDFHNEDAFLVRDALGLYAVCDGLGAGPAGETASQIAVAAVEDYFAPGGPGPGPDAWLRGPETDAVEGALHHVHRALDEARRLDPELAGMDTTLTMLLAHGDRGVIGHLGDSRAYLMRRGRAHQLSRDHDLTAALPSGAVAEGGIQVFAVDLEPGDRLVLCSDGAESAACDRAIARVAHELSPAVLASRIASAAHRSQPGVDATVVVVRIGAEGERHDLSLPGQEASFRHRVLERGQRGD